MEYARQFVYSSNALRLSARQWLLLAGVLLALAFGIPAAWVWFEPFRPCGDYRLPYEFSQDYWHCARWFREAARAGRVLVIGDSVVWGEYVGLGDTLTAQLNRRAGEERFANLGVNGLHPAAMLGMLRYHGGVVRGRDVVVVLNTLWMSSARHDLREVPADGESGRATLNHPALVPQFWPSVPAYSAPFEERAGIVVERAIPFFGWMEHQKFKGARLEGGGAGTGRDEESGDAGSEPRIDDPLPRPFAGFRAQVPQPTPGPHGQPLTWEERGIPVGGIPWPAARESLQWRFFRDVIGLLQSRGNRVFVWVSPFNPHLLNPESRASHETMVRAMAEELRLAGVDVFCGTPLPSEEYADASHPLAPGYVRLAQALLADGGFRAWLAGDGRRVREWMK